MTDTERVLWRRLRQRQIGGLKFRHQHPIEKFVVDFVCLERKLIVELDGSQHVEMMGEDEKRTAFLQHRGYKVIRFWNNQVFDDIEGVLSEIAFELNDDPHPYLSPARGKGKNSMQKHNPKNDS